MKKEMNEQQKARLIKAYKLYNVVDWIIAIAIIVTPIVFSLFELHTQGSHPEQGIPNALENLMQQIGNIPAPIIIPIFIVYSPYTIGTIVLYIKIWPVKEIPKGFQYWFDWVLTAALTAYELFIFYLILFA